MCYKEGIRYGTYIYIDIRIDRGGGAYIRESVYKG